MCSKSNSITWLHRTLERVVRNDKRSIFNVDTASPIVLQETAPKYSGASNSHLLLLLFKPLFPSNS